MCGGLRYILRVVQDRINRTFPKSNWKQYTVQVQTDYNCVCARARFKSWKCWLRIETLIPTCVSPGWVQSELTSSSSSVDVWAVTVQSRYS